MNAVKDPIVDELASALRGLVGCHDSGYEICWCDRCNAAKAALAKLAPPVVTLPAIPPIPAVIAPAPVPEALVEKYRPSPDRNETIKRIKTALERRSGKKWSVTGGRGTAWGWIRIYAPPARCTWKSRLKAGADKDSRDSTDYEDYDAGLGTESGNMGPGDRAELGKLLGCERPVHHQGVNIAASNDHYNEYIDRAEGRSPAKVAQPYWD